MEIWSHNTCTAFPFSPQAHETLKNLAVEEASYLGKKKVIHNCFKRYKVFIIIIAITIIIIIIIVVVVALIFSIFLNTVQQTIWLILTLFLFLVFGQTLLSLSKLALLASEQTDESKLEGKWYLVNETVVPCSICGTNARSWVLSWIRL